MSSSYKVLAWAVSIAVLVVAVWAFSAHRPAAYTWPATATTTTTTTTTTVTTTTGTSTALVAGPGEHCGGNMTTARSCSTEYHCAPAPGSHLPFGDVGGTCVAGQ